ncbi:MAG: 3,4-dihydroxy-2-butanone-4-phosphate synthase [Candidatus Muproteobacteria bacterium RIFCSPHIGHO2_12_FULL_60_33]|uniref:3,4-dihydroxy-2-butanone 4-phosphate synthase n=1 Tax=Candidatus Muproteobacteria bacterium RIFCSPLOWO2_01_FULL_60_18 TaxID=1817768 RepID=A0A1F6TX81_9PROT|nr:MAG: 3,4-dihydroxy-2-butanone-4-phosphate synthase [Candidatus Muproteobacteria bacterium RIFCSPLOWO2_01_FULL_60_18]OGI55028.1 MAG: 3,4-dihydroxy-2-butanone-4-phosphate synthase [Candidatus Muproteobacteria bacterium RIFCSPHIGHO2_12_FULL_60_33]OGI60729.1 MAG: 3,4-dihydroxy-2-butanone-4-phosphate synthase [Candidatus Muproteobacteria bacterium RIFCSPHIGHO2_01_FULL_61_200]
MPISPITEIIDEIKRGRMVVLMDDEDRENEGDLVMAGAHARAEDINFMARHGRGLICLTLTQERCRQLRLPLMVSDTQQRRSTNFTVTIEAAEGVTTGISAADRARTIQAAVKKDAKPSDLVQPGHVFPLMAQRGGVLARAGHTEAGVDLARLAGLEPASVICEIMNEDGAMARLPELETFAQQHGLKIGTIADLIRYRNEHESTIQRVGECVMPTEFGDFRVLAYHDDIGDSVHLALVRSDIRRDRPTLVRVHMQESLLDLVTTAHRAGSWSLHEALAYVAAAGAGVVVILQQEEKPADLVQRIRHFQGQGKALESSGGKRGHQEMRTYGLGSQILADLGVSKMRVLGHAMKAPGLSGFGLEIVEYIGNDPAQLSSTHRKQNKEKKVSG